LGQGSDKEVIIESFMESLDHDNIAGSSTNVVWNDQNQCVSKKIVNSVVCFDFNCLFKLNLL